ncbi:uncharacterized protein LOC131162836 [Malania oleifera]|uniref:uncharacterized protein LOC131162836 n=1 Tax=Malania oleifera TaxID=397392 RepID=UPI0025AE28EB|nr:uncharacterized protein LOC131162836 [Malania oleifera]
MREIGRSFMRRERSPTAAGCTIERFTRMHPPMFLGGPDLMIVEDWVEKTERILEVLHCTDKQRVLYATFQLSGVAGRWWTAVSLLEKQRASLIEMMWSRFKEVFFERYFPDSTCDAKVDEFSVLKQGDITVQGYAAQYIKLSRFIPCLISNEYEKTWRFKKSPRKDIRRLVGMLQIRAFSILVDKATIIETDIWEDEVDQESKKRPVPSGSSKGSWKKKNKGLGYCQNTERQGAQVDQSRDCCIRCHKWHEVTMAPNTAKRINVLEAQVETTTPWRWPRIFRSHLDTSLSYHQQIEKQMKRFRELLDEYLCYCVNDN